MNKEIGRLAGRRIELCADRKIELHEKRVRINTCTYKEKIIKEKT
jgi:hypothetical protein